MEKRNKSNKKRGNGEGTIYWSETLQKYVAQYVEPSGKRKTLTQKKNEKVGDFKKRFANIMNSINNDSYIEKCNDTFEQIAKRYIEQKYSDGLVSDRTYNRDLSTLEQIKKTSPFYNKPIQKITIDDIESAKKDIKKYSNSVISKMWGLIKKTFSVAYSLEKINKNIMLNDFLTKPISNVKDKPIEALSVEEENKLINVLNNQEKEHRYRDVILLQLYTGMRIGEVLALSKDCIDLKNNTITVYRTVTLDKNNNFVLGEHTKTYKKSTNVDKGKRTFPMTHKAREIIKKVLSNKIINLNNLLFYDYENNTLITRTEINSYLNRINEKYSICAENLHSHRLRHTFVTRCFESGINLKTIQAIVGHTNGSSITLDVYTTVSNDFIATELEKLK